MGTRIHQSACITNPSYIYTLNPKPSITTFFPGTWITGDYVVKNQLRKKTRSCTRFVCQQSQRFNLDNKMQVHSACESIHSSELPVTTNTSTQKTNQVRMICSNFYMQDLGGAKSQRTESKNYSSVYIIQVSVANSLVKLI